MPRSKKMKTLDGGNSWQEAAARTLSKAAMNTPIGKAAIFAAKKSGLGGNLLENVASGDLRALNGAAPLAQKANEALGNGVATANGSLPVPNATNQGTKGGPGAVLENLSGGPAAQKPGSPQDGAAAPNATAQPTAGAAAGPAAPKAKGVAPESIVYGTSLALAISIFFGIFIMILIDAGTFAKRQAEMTNFINGELVKKYVKDTNDYKIVQYPTATIETESNFAKAEETKKGYTGYLIYKQQSMIDTLILLVGIVASGLMFQFAYYGYKIVRANYYGDDPPEGLPIDPENMWILVLILVITIGVMCLNVYYKNTFVGSVIPSLQSQRENLRSLRTHVINSLPIKNNLPTEFWTQEIGKTPNIDLLGMRIGNLLKNATNKSSNEVKLAQKIIFAYNLKMYMNKYHDGLIADEQNEQYKLLRGLFSKDGFKKQFDIVKLLKVTNNFNVPPLAQYHTQGTSSLESKIREYVQGGITSDMRKSAFDAGGAQTDGELSDQANIDIATQARNTATEQVGGQCVQNAVMDKFEIYDNEATRVMNTKLDAVRNMGTGKHALYNFIIGAIAISLLFLVICIAVIVSYKWDKVKPMWDGFVALIKSIRNSATKKSEVT